MIDDSEEFKSIIYTVTELVKADKLDDLTDLLINSQITIQQTSYDTWNGGRYSYTIYLAVDVTRFIAIRDKISSIEEQIGQIFDLVTRHLDDQDITKITLIPKASAAGKLMLNPHRPLSSSEITRRNHLIKYLLNASEDELIMEVLLPLFRQLGFQRLTVAGHKDKALEYGKDVWMKFILPTQHILYFGIQAKKGKLDSSGMSKATNMNVAEIYNQVSMMLGHEIFDPEIGKRVLVDHAFIVAGGEITKAARNWIGGKLDTLKRSQIIFMDKEDILNLFIVNNVPLPSGAIPEINNSDDDLPF